MTDTINIPRAELQQILAAYKEISSPLDCGCWPCKGECRNAFSLGIVVEEYQHLANKQIPILEARLAQQEEKPEPVAWNKSIRDSVDSLLAQAGFELDSSVRHQLAMMNFESTTVPLKNWRNAIPGGRHTDQWESCRVADYNKGWNEYRKAAKAALEKLEVAPPPPQQKEQEPVAWISKHGVVYPLDAKDEVNPVNELQPLYTAPPKREWVGLTDEEIKGVLETTHPENRWTIAERIESKLKEKNGY